MRTTQSLTPITVSEADTLVDRPARSRSPFTTDYYTVTPVSPMRIRGQVEAIPRATPKLPRRPQVPVMYGVTRLDLVAVLVALALAVGAGGFWATLAHGSSMAAAETRIAALTKANAELQEQNDTLTNEVCNDQ